MSARSSSETVIKSTFPDIGVDFHEIRKFLGARRAPCRPKVDEQRPAVRFEDLSKALDIDLDHPLPLPARL